MLAPEIQKKIALLEAHYKSMGKILSELKADQPKRNRKLNYDQEAQVLANRLSKIKS